MRGVRLLAVIRLILAGVLFTGLSLIANQYRLQVPPLAHAAGNNCVSTQTGNWSAPSTWTSCGSSYPQAADNAEIAGSTVVTADIEISVVNLTIDSGATLITSTGNITIAGNYANSGTLTAASGTLVFSASDTGHTVSGTLNGSSSPFNIQFTGIGGAWTITDPMRVNGQYMAVNAGTVTMGNSAGDNLEITGALQIGSSTGADPVFQIAALPTGEQIILDVNLNNAGSPPNCGVSRECSIDVGSGMFGVGKGTLKINKNTLLRLNRSSNKSTQINVSDQGDFEAVGSQDYTGTLTSTTNETTATDSLQNWTIDENNNKVLRLTSGLAKGRLYPIMGTSTHSLTRASTESAPSTLTVTGSSDTRTVCAATNSLIASDKEQIGRYLHDSTNNIYFQIINSTNNDANCANNDSFIVVNNPDSFSNLANGDTFSLTDGVRSGDHYEILDEAKITAEAGTGCTALTDHPSYAQSEIGSDHDKINLQYVELCDMQSLDFGATDHTNLNEGTTVSDVWMPNDANIAYGSSYGSFSDSYLTSNINVNSDHVTIDSNILEGSSVNLNSTNATESNNTIITTGTGTTLCCDIDTHDTLSGNTFVGNDTGLTLTGITDATIENNTLYGSRQNAIHATYNLGPSNDNSITNNLLVGNANGINFESGDGNVINQNNVSSQLSGSYTGIWLHYGAEQFNNTNATINENTINNYATGIELQNLPDETDTHSDVSNNTIGLILNSGSGIRAQNFSGATFTYNDISGSSALDDFMITGGTSLTLNHNTLTDPQNSAITLEADTIGQDSISDNTITLNNTVYGVSLISGHDITIDHNTLTGPSTDAMYLPASGLSTLTATNNTISGCNDYGINIGVLVDSTFGNNTINTGGDSNCAVSGAGLYFGQDPTGTTTISGNTISQEYIGVDSNLATISNLTFSNNTITGTHSFGANLQISSLFTAANNNITNSGDSGLRLSGSSSALSTISGNTFSNNSGKGLYIPSNQIEFTATNNTISNNTEEGIYYVFGGNSTFSSNTINANDSGIDAFGSTNLTIENNTLSNNRNAGFNFGELSGSHISGNIVSNSSTGLNLNEATNNTVSTNTLTGNNVGIYLKFNSRGNIISNNNIDSNSVGMDVSDVANTYTGNEFSANGAGVYPEASNISLVNSTITGNQYGIYDNGYGVSVIGGSITNNTLGDYLQPRKFGQKSQFFGTTFGSANFPQEGYLIASGKSYSQIIGIDFEVWQNGHIVVFYNDGTYSTTLFGGVDVTTKYVNAPSIYHYTLAAGKTASQVIGVAQDTWNSGRVAVFYNDGTYSSTDDDSWGGTGDINFPNLHNYTLANGYTPSQVIGVTVDDWNEGHLAVFYNDGHYSVNADNSWDGTADVDLSAAVHSYTLAAGKTASQVKDFSDGSWSSGPLVAWYDDGTFSLSTPGNWDSDQDVNISNSTSASASTNNSVIIHGDGTAGETKIFGDYSASQTNVAETPQDEASNVYNYANNSWEKSVTPHTYAGSGSQASDLHYNVTSANLSGGPYNYLLVSTTDNQSCSSTTFSVYRNAQLVGTATCGVEFTDSNASVNTKFTIDGGATNYSFNDTYAFTAYDAANDINVAKHIVVANSSRVTIPGSATIDLEGKSDGSADTTVGVASNSDYYSFINQGQTILNNADLTLTGNWTNAGTFTPGKSTLTLTGGDQTLSGSTAFDNLTAATPGQIIRFQQASSNLPTFTFDGNLSVAGSTQSHITIQSDTAGSQWLASFAHAQTSVTDASIKDSGCVTGSNNVTLDNSSTNLGDNGNCWVFPGETSPSNSGESSDTNVTIPPVVVPALIPPRSFIGRLLSYFSFGNDVKLLQEFLNDNGYIVAKKGSGSPGHETKFFGPATRRALTAFQKAHPVETCRVLDSSTGIGSFGTTTRNFLNSQPDNQFHFTRNLRLLNRGNDVIALKKYLNSHGFQLAKTGTDSPGHESPWYTIRLRRSLQAFQLAHQKETCQVLTPWIGLGNLGKSTRNYIDSLIK